MSLSYILSYKLARKDQSPYIHGRQQTVGKNVTELDSDTNNKNI